MKYRILHEGWEVMKKPVNLQDIIGGMEMQFDESRNLLNLKTGEVITVSDEGLRMAEDDEPFDDLPEWQQENIKTAIDVFENYEHYEEIPSKYDINEYEMMEDFSYELKNERHKETLLDAIRGRGAFRRFKDKVNFFGIEQVWYTYRDQKYKEKAIEWCKDLGLEYKE